MDIERRERRRGWEEEEEDEGEGISVEEKKGWRQCEVVNKWNW